MILNTNSLDSKKILIIGIDSFTGRYLSAYLVSKGYDVYGTSFLFSENSKIYSCDITDKNQIEDIIGKVRPDFLINLSGISFAGHGDSLDFFKINLFGVENILDALIKLKWCPKKVILVSSATVYGNQKTSVLDESLAPSPNNYYGISKLAMEFMVRNYFEAFPVIITRPFNYTGIGQSKNFVVPKIVDHFKKKLKTIELGNIDVIREFNDVYFVCEAYEKLLKCKESSIIANLCSRRGVSLWSIIETLEEIAGYKINVKVNKKFMRENEVKELVGSTEFLFSIIKPCNLFCLKDMLESMYKGSDNS